MAPERPERIGKLIELVPRHHGKTLIEKRFRNPKNGEEYDYRIFDAEPNRPSILLPITIHGEVIAVRQFRHAVEEWIYELPGGNSTGPETPEEVAANELLEETGYKTGNITLLTKNPIWFEPTAYTAGYYALLATSCVRTTHQKLDETEYIAITRIPFRQWIRMIDTGIVRDSKSIVITHLALRHLGIVLDIPENIAEKVIA